MEPAILATAGASLIIGLGLGLIASKLFFSAQKDKSLEQHLHQAQDELKSYQLEVTQHFTETAQLLKKMAESYRDVHNHLASGANNLSKDSSGMPLMNKLPEIETVAGQTDEPAHISPPLDYAPKQSPYDRGTLHTDHHLEKVQLVEEPVDMAETLSKHS